MSVINTKYDLPPKDSRCAVCGGPLQFPFLCWDQAGSGSDLCICGECCHRIKDGLMADMIQIAAILDMRKLRQLSDHHSVTLVRRKYEELEAEGEKREQDEIAAASTIPRLTPRGNR